MGMKSKRKCPAHIAEHVRNRGEGHHYVGYYDGSVHYDLPYWTFVNLAKDAGATIELHKTAIADTNAVDRYLDEHCLVPADKTNTKESAREMKRRIQDIEKSEKWLKAEQRSGCVMKKGQNSILSVSTVSRRSQRMPRRYTKSGISF